MILQVEDSRYYLYDLNGSGYYDDGHKFFWRDAKLSDYTSSVLNVGRN